MNVESPVNLGLLTVCGSLQGRSANRAALEVASAVAVASGVLVDDFDRLADVPAFDPDRVEEPIEVIDDWRRQVSMADVVLVAAPEYAGAVAGVVKNAFDWLVGSGELYRKPVAVLSAGTSGGLHARRMMAQTLTWQGAYVVAELGIAAPRTKSDERGRLNDEATLAALASLTHVLLGAPAMAADQLVRLATRVVDSLGIDVVHVAPAAAWTSTSRSALATSSSSTGSASSSISTSEDGRHDLVADQDPYEAAVSLIAMRVARPTADLHRIRSFYEHVVGLPLLWSFADHDGFDGAIFGLPDERAQLEVVCSPHGDVPTPSKEDALVLYHEGGTVSGELINRLRRAGITEVTVDDPTLNPYWPRQGARTFIDPDGYGLIIVAT